MSEWRVRGLGIAVWRKAEGIFSVCSKCMKKTGTELEGWQAGHFSWAQGPHLVVLVAGALL